MKWSAIIIVSALLGCTPLDHGTHQNGQALAGPIYFQKNYKTVPMEPYLTELGRSIDPAIQSVTLLVTDTCIAASFSEGSVFISTECIKSLPSEAALAFVLAHEAAHIKLRHHDEVVSAQNEIEADKLGLMLLYRSGYDVKESISALTLGDTHHAPHYPSVTERLDENMKNLRSTPISALSIKSTHRFTVFKDSL